MKRIIILAGLSLVLLSGCMRWHGHGEASMARHHDAMRKGIPERYQTIASSPGSASKGMEIYSTQCAVCHGVTGVGNGPIAAQLEVKPADLSSFGSMPRQRARSFLNWAITEGGSAYGTPMPAFGQSLSVKDIQDVSEYILGGFKK